MRITKKGKFGSELMRLVASKLRLGRNLVSNHRDYCGYGLFYENNQYNMGIAHDGTFDQKEIIHSWNKTEEFIAYFAPLTDFKCSGKAKEELFSNGPIENQRITKSRLIEFLGEYGLCPTCNEILFSTKAIQCPHCKVKW
ncbi:MAG: hypothetical protein AB7D06_01545 [Pedobacter sp.]